MVSQYKTCQCPFCSFSSKQEKRFYAHLHDEHSITDVQELYVKHVLLGAAMLCGCGCSQVPAWNGWKQGFTSRFLRGHNASIVTSFTDPEVIKKSVAKRIEGLQSGRFKVWNDGLTKETSESVKSQAKKVSVTLKKMYESGAAVSWQSGLTKETDDRIARASSTHREGYRTGRIKSWNKGLTKETSKIVEQIANHINQTVSSNVDSSSKRFKEDQICKLLSGVSDRFKLLTDVNDYRNRHQRLEFMCLTCGNVQSKSLQMVLNTPRCFACVPKGSLGQSEVSTFVKSMGFDVIDNDRSAVAPLELDVYVPSERFAIEFNGLYWHSEAVLRDSDHMLKKLRACQGAGIRLLHVFEDEWRDKRGIVESMIRHRLKKTTKRLHARKLRLIDVSTSQRRMFFNSNHVAGDANAAACFGLLDGQELVAALSLRRAFHACYSGLYEVGRFCTALDTSVTGGLGRLAQAALRYAQAHGKTGLLTYVDESLGDGLGYEMVGFKAIERVSSPRFWWTDFQSRFNRFKHRADRARGLTQEQVAAEAGVVKIWGCPNRVMVLNAVEQCV